MVDAYISALPLTAVAIVTDGRRCRLVAGGEPAPGETIERRLYFKPSHADLVLSMIVRLPSSPAAVAALIERTAADMGAPVHALADLRRAAEKVVAEVTARVDAGRQNGDLKLVNRQYRTYRLAQVAKAEKAISYTSFLQRWMVGLVRDVAVIGRAV